MKQSLSSLFRKRLESEPITWLTCYDYSFATALNATDLDLILVGDSGGMVSLGYQDTNPVSVDEMIILSKAVRRGAPDKFIVGDMPKGSYEESDIVAIRTAMRFVKEAGCDAVKLEGASVMTNRVRAIVESGIPVIGHIGLTPQTSGNFGGYRVVGRSESESILLINQANDLANAGAFAILLEAIPPKVAQKITSKVSVITFGIGAGSEVNGQLLILHDLLGLFPSFRPKFAKCFIPQVLAKFDASLMLNDDLQSFGRTTRRDGFHELSRLAVAAFILEVKQGTFPDPKYSYKD